MPSSLHHKPAKSLTQRILTHIASTGARVALKLDRYVTKCRAVVVMDLYIPLNGTDGAHGLAHTTAPS